MPRRRGSFENEDGKQKKQRSQEKTQQKMMPAEVTHLPEKRFKDHRRSNGLEFIDIRKEIVSELKQIGHRLNLSSNKGTKRLNIKKKKALENEKGKTDNFVETSALLNLRQSKSQRQAVIEKTDEDENEEDVNKK